MEFENGGKTKAEKREAKRRKQKEMIVTGKSALLWEKLKIERAEKLKKRKK